MTTPTTQPDTEIAELRLQNTQLTEMVRQLLEAKQKPSVLLQWWNRCKSYIIPIILVMIVCGQFAYIAIQTKPIANQQSTILEHQAAVGGAAVPFPSVSPLPPLLTSPPENLIEEPSDSMSTNTSEESSPNNPQADSGQKTSERYYRLPLRRTR